MWVGWVEQEAMRKPGTPTGGQLPVFALDVVDHHRAGPGQQRRHDQPDAFAGARRRESHDMLRPVMTQVLVLKLTKEHARRPEQPGLSDLPLQGPARGPIGRHQPALPRAPQRTDHRRRAAHEAGCPCQHARLVEHLGRIGLKEIPPLEQLPRLINRPAGEDEPWRSELRLIAQHVRAPLCRRPHAQNDDGEHNSDLADQEFGGGHGKGLRSSIRQTEQVSRAWPECVIALMYDELRPNSVIFKQQHNYETKYLFEIAYQLK